jgi:hypothetical protein
VWEPEEYDQFVESEIERDGARGKERWLVECSDCGVQSRQYSMRTEAEKVVAEHKGMGHKAWFECRYELPNGCERHFPFREGL